MAADPRSLVGGHAAGNLTSEEKRELYRAALDDQALFDALVDEEPLRELLEDPVAVQRLRAVLAEEPPRRGWIAIFSSDWMPAAAALLLAAALVPLIVTLVDRPAVEDEEGFAVSRPTADTTRPVAAASAVDWAATVEGAVANERRLALRAAVPKEFGPLGRERRQELRIVPDRSGRAMVIGITASGDAEKVYPPGDARWADVEADVPVDVPLPAAAPRFTEFRLVIVDSGADLTDLPARLDEGKAVVFRVRSN